MADITDFGDTSDPLNGPLLGGPTGWAAAVADAITALQNNPGGVTDHGALTGLGDNDHPQYQLVSARGAVNGYAPLDATGKVPTANLPDTGGGPTGDVWGRWSGTQAEYDALGTYDPNTLYVIVADPAPVELTRSQIAASGYAEGTTRVVSIPVTAGDLIVVRTVVGLTETNPTIANDGAALTWTKQTGYNTSSWSVSTAIHTAVADSNRTIQITVTVPASQWMQVVAEAWTGHGGVGGVLTTTASGSTPKGAFTTTAAGSAVVCVGGDKNAQDGSMRTFLTNFGAATDDAYGSSSQATAYVWSHLDAGAAATADVGLTIAGATAFALSAIEILAAP